MTTKKAQFGWKRKSSSGLNHHVAKLFRSQRNLEYDEGKNFDNEKIDWLHLARRTGANQLESADAKSDRLKNEGNVLAVHDRYWEAIKMWDEAIELTPNRYCLYELKAQSFMQLNEIFPAVNAAEKATKLNPLWPDGFQTLGRCQMGLGEVEMAIRSFQIALHLDPSNKEVWNEDLAWARSVQIKFKKLDQKAKGTRYSVHVN